ncbi:ATP-grasp domain-containing protein [Gemmatimonas sp.]|uniref:ATP-grasp domain-containing protein n=1 Tax=Gemmatimonas sp. TaxID=1962908 RepID=UPI0022C8A6CE|nr:ATP-grasp domain-containing protein [Gemmatimonas sp.]MCZ8204504.1 ATP-grasp domain-containing protein [Gemmatimonas sp.]
MSQTVLMITPGFPGEMPLFTRGLSVQGAQVLGVANGPAHDLPEMARRHLSDYLQVPDLFSDTASAIAQIRRWLGSRTLDRVCCLWEPGIELAAHLREAFDVPGQRFEQAVKFRNKDLMKQALAEGGVRVPHHAVASSAADVWAAAEVVGYPLIIKPIAGAGSMDTFRCDDAKEVAAAISQLGHIETVDVEEFIDGEEFTYDTICAGGEIKYFHVGHYRPRPLIARTNEWISPQTLSYRHVDNPWVTDGMALGEQVIRVLGYDTGFTHMEWYRKSDGEVVFGEIGARPPGARTVDLMNFASDIDLFAGWAEAELHGTFSPVVERKFNCACITKRAHGQGRIQRIEGLDRIKSRLGDALCAIDLLPVGTPRRDWKSTLLSDGYVTLRHPDWDTCKALADFVGTDLHLYAG